MKTNVVDWATLQDDASDSSGQQEQKVEKQQLQKKLSLAEVKSQPDVFENKQAAHQRKSNQFLQAGEQQLSRLEEITGNEVWLYVFKKSKMIPEEVEAKIALLKTLKVIQSKTGWDIKVSRQDAQRVLKGPNRFPYYQLGNKNFRTDRSERNYGQRRYADYDYEPYSARRAPKYVLKQEKKPQVEEEKVGQTSSNSQQKVANEFEFKSTYGVDVEKRVERKLRNDDNRNDRNERNGKMDRKQFEETKSKEEFNRFGTGIGAFRNNHKQEPRSELWDKQPSSACNLVELTKQSSQYQPPQLSSHKSQKDLISLPLKKMVSDAPKKRYKLKEQQPKQQYKPTYQQKEKLLEKNQQIKQVEKDQHNTNRKQQDRQKTRTNQVQAALNTNGKNLDQKQGREDRQQVKSPSQPEKERRKKKAPEPIRTSNNPFNVLSRK